MISTRLGKALMLSCLISPALFADIHDRIEYKLNRVLRDTDIIINGNTANCTPINQLEIDQQGGTYTITVSGEYCVTENVKGNIVVDADCVCIDLNCHTIDADGAAWVILSTGHSGLRVSNGCLTNAAVAVISLDNCDAVELSYLHIYGYPLIGIGVEDSVDLNVHDVNFINNNDGEYALIFDTVNNITVNHVNASGFLSTIGAIVQLDSCNNASIQDVDLSNNTKAIATYSGSFGILSRFVSVDSCTGVDLVRVKVNNNTNANADPIINRFSAIGIANSSSCSMHRCETSNNVSIYGDAGAAYVTLDRAVFIGACENVIVTEHQANNNSYTPLEGYTAPIAAFRAYSPLFSSGLVFDGCQANNNSVALSSGELSVFFTQESVGDDVLRNCQANFNTILDAVDSPYYFLSGFWLTNNSYAEGCQANHNTMVEISGGYVVGFLLNSDSPDIDYKDVILSNCAADNNNGGEFPTGIFVMSFDEPDFGVINTYNQTIRNCSASSNGRYGIYVGLTIPSGFGDMAITRNVAILDCVCNKNGSAVYESAGIFVVDYVSNVLIKGCQVFDTFSEGDQAAGIAVENASNVVIEDTNVFNTVGYTEGHGIVFENVDDSKIIRTQLHGNQNAGVELTGDNEAIAIIECVAIGNDVGFEVAATSTATCCLVQDSRALSNLTFGFAHIPTDFSTTFIGNEAQCNGDGTTEENYVIHGGVISLYELAWDTGLMCNISGEPTISSWTNVSAVETLSCV